MKNFWTIAITTSVMLHSALLFGLPMLPSAQQDKKSFTRTMRLIRKEIPKTQEIKKTFAPPPPKYVDRLSAYGEKDLTKKPNYNQAANTITTLKETVSIEQTINKELAKLPAYANYYQLIRGKIRQNAFQYYNSSATGEVFLTFTILRDGHLELVSLSQDSDATEALREIASKSIKEASPFPEFPEELKNYKRLQFSISISFKNR